MVNFSRRTKSTNMSMNKCCCCIDLRRGVQLIAAAEIVATVVGIMLLIGYE